MRRFTQREGEILLKALKFAADIERTRGNKIAGDMLEEMHSLVRNNQSDYPLPARRIEAQSDAA